MRAKTQTILVISMITILAASAFATSMLANPFVSSASDERKEHQQDIEYTDTFSDDYHIISEIPSTTTGSGTLMDVIESATGIFDERTAMANDSTTFYPQTYDIPEDWFTTEITAISSKMYHLTDWVSNGHFTSDASYWAANDQGDIGVIDENYDSLGGYIYLVRSSGGKVKYDYWGAWNQTVSVTEGGTSSAVLNVTYKIDTTTGSNGQNAQPYMYVNGTIWELPSGGARFSADQDWTTYSLNLPLDIYTFPGTLEVSFGIRGWAETQFQTEGQLSIDDVSLTLKTSRDPEVVDLRARDVNNPTNIVSFTKSPIDGKGYATFSGNWTNDVQLEFLSNETGTEFALELDMPLTRNNNLLTNTYSVSNGTVVTWESEFTAQEMAYPFVYDHFNVTLPHDWTVNTVYDAYGDIQLLGTTYYNATLYSNQGILMCDVAGTGTSGTPHYGKWSIESSSPNYGEYITFYGDSGTWLETGTFYPGESMRLEAGFLDGFDNPPLISGSGSVSIYDIEEQLIYTESDLSIDSSGIVLFQNGTGTDNITIQNDWLAGPLTAVATWNNGTAVGLFTKSVDLFHTTELEIESAVYTAYRGDIVSVRVKYIDSETGLGIAGAELYFNWTYGSDLMTYAGNGWYAGYVDTSMAVIGGYVVDVNATKPYNDFATTDGITIEVQEKTTLYSPRDGTGTPTTDYEIAWGNSKTIYIAYEDTIAMNPTSITASTGSPATPDETNSFTSNNVYTTIDSVGNAISVLIESDIDYYNFAEAELNTLLYKLEGKFSVSGVSGQLYAYNYDTTSWELAVSSFSPTTDTSITWETDNPSAFISSTGEVRARIDATHTSPFSLSIDLFDFVGYRPIDDTVPANGAITTDWEAQSVVGTQIDPFYNTTLNVWQVTFNTEDVTPGEYTVLIDATATGHQDKNIELTIVVRAHHTRVTAMPPSETPWSWNTYINVSIVDTDNSSLIISENNITSLVVTSTFGTQTFVPGVNLTYSSTPGYATVVFGLETNVWDVGTESVDIQVITAGSGLSKFFDNGNSPVDVNIRSHDIRVTVNQPPETPWSWRTQISLTVTDLDNSTIEVNPGNITSIEVAGQTFTSTDWVYSGGKYYLWVDTAAWSIQTYQETVAVTTSSSAKLFYDGSGPVQVTIREHNIAAYVSPPGPTPWGQNTTLIVEIRDTDNSSIMITESNITQIIIDSTSYTSADWTYSNTGTYATFT
ncbi:MAG: exported protein of unknown function, partial [Candidatus Thorarchaeota archaeon]